MRLWAPIGRTPRDTHVLINTGLFMSFFIETGGLARLHIRAGLKRPLCRNGVALDKSGGATIVDHPRNALNIFFKDICELFFFAA